MLCLLCWPTRRCCAIEAKNWTLPISVANGWITVYVATNESTSNRTRNYLRPGMTSSNRPRPRSILSNLDPHILGTLKSLLLREPRRLDDYYDIGEQMESLEKLIAAAPGTARGNNWRKQLAQSLEVSDSTLSKC